MHPESHPCNRHTPSVGSAGVAEWNPWRELRAREHIVFMLDPIAEVGGGAAYYRRGDRAAIVIDPDLDQRQRAAALAHELVHDELASAGPPLPPGVPVHPMYERRTDRLVDRIAAGRLLPLRPLHEFCERQTDAGLDVQPHDVAEEFDVAEDVAVLQLHALRRRLEESETMASYAYADARIAADLEPHDETGETAWA